MSSHNVASRSPGPGRSRTLELAVHRCINVPASLTYGIIKKRDFFIEVTVGSESKRTKNSQRSGHQLVWNEKLSFNVVGTSHPSLALYSHPTFSEPVQIGRHILDSFEMHGNDVPPTFKQVVLVPNGAEIEFTFSVNDTVGHTEVIGRSSVSRVVTAALPTLGVDVTPPVEEQAEGESEPENMKALKASSEAVRAVELLRTLGSGYKRILECVTSFRDVVSGIAEVHPFARIVCLIIFAIPGPLLEQLQRDEDVKGLLDALTGFCEIVEDSKGLDLAKHEKIRDVLRRSSLQLTEVAYFISQYCKQGSFLKRAVKLFGTGNTIKEYQAKLQDMKEEFRTRLELRTGAIVAETKVKVVRVLQDVERIAESIDLNDLTYIPGAGLNGDKLCLVGTREGILDEIAQWINSDGPRILLLSGGAGTGKSSIAHTIAARFKALGRLGSMFCFNETDKNTRSPASLFPHIARDLADLDANIRVELWKAVQSKADRTTFGIALQFETFVLKPAKVISDNFHGPIVVVIDALDESGSPRERERLLQVLRTQFKALPPNFRVLITSRPELDIEKYLPNGADILVKRMHSIPQESTTKDITAYIETQFAEVPKITSEMCRTFACHAHGLFQWARVACDFVRFGGFGEDPLDRYEELIHPLVSNAGNEIIGDNLLDSLYTSVLSKSLLLERKNALTNFKFVMSRVLTAFEPLSRRSLNEFITASKIAPKGCTAETGVAFLGSLLSGVDSPDIPIRPLHTSFRDFLTNSGRSAKFFIDLALQDVHSDMAWASLSIMNRELKFNICHLPSSHRANKDIEGIEELIKENIRPHLSYACRFWANHLCSLSCIVSTATGEAPLPVMIHDWSGLVAKLGETLSNRVLYWLEVLSLLGWVEIGLDQIRHVRLWTKRSSIGKTLTVLIEDLERFYSYFAKCIAKSAPHIYISALPFAPKTSFLATTYTKPLNKTLSVIRGKLESYPSCLNILQGHFSSVDSVAFSPDGLRIVSGSRDQSVRVWSAQSGEMILGPLFGHDGRIYSVAFSPNGTCVVSGSQDLAVRVWNAQNGAILRIFKGHVGSVVSVSFSPDGNYIASGSHDKTVRVWSIQSGEMALGPLLGHTKFLSAVQFSPDGSRIASGSHDGSIRIWNAKTGEMTLAIPQIEDSPVTSISFSPDSIYIASGSLDHTIEIHNVENGKVMLGPLKGHTGQVTALAFSLDGTRIASSSLDCSIRVWDTLDGETVLGPLQGHVVGVDTIAFSPDGSRIASGSRDGTIRIWDALNIEEPAKLPPVYNAKVTSVVFSPDGTRLASGSKDKTVRVWDTQNSMLLRTCEGHTDSIESVAFSPDGAYIVSGSEDCTIRVWNAENGTVVLGPLEGHALSVLSAIFSPDGTRILSGSLDTTIRVWSMESGNTVLGPLRGHTGPIISAVFSPDGSLIASSSWDRTIRIWNADNGEIISKPWQDDKIAPGSISFSPDGSRIVSSSMHKPVFVVWDVRSGEIVCEISDRTKLVSQTIALSPDGTRVASDLAGGIAIWDTQTGKLILGPLQGHDDVVRAMSFSPDGARLASGGHDHTIRIWNVENDKTVFPFESHDCNAGIGSPDAFCSQLGVLPRYNWEIEDGWSLGTKGELLFYVPPAHRKHLCGPRTKFVLGPEYYVVLDMSQFAHGHRWTEAFSTGDLAVSIPR